MEQDRERDTPGKRRFSLAKIGKKELILLFLAGFVLVITSIPGLLPGNNETKKNTTKVPSTITNRTQNTEDEQEMEYISHYENKLKKLLEKMEGVGKAEVMITLKSSKEQIVLKDAPYTQESLNETDKEGGSRISSNTSKGDTTVLITTKEGENIPYVTKEITASVEGVVVLAQGGGDGNIATRIVRAVEVLFHVPAHKVQVLKMGS